MESINIIQKEITELQKYKQELLTKLCTVNNEIDYLISQIYNICNHENVIRFKEYDGHSYKIYYKCKSCSKNLYQINDNNKVVTTEII